MAGEQSKEDLTPEEYPLHFAVAEAFGGTVEPFDVYQGPYVDLPGRRLWLNADGWFYMHWYDDLNNEVSDGFIGDPDIAVGVVRTMLDIGGTPVEEWREEQEKRKSFPARAPSEALQFARALWDQASPNWKPYIMAKHPNLAKLLESEQ